MKPFSPSSLPSLPIFMSNQCSLALLCCLGPSAEQIHIVEAVESCPYTFFQPSKCIRSLETVTRKESTQLQEQDWRSFSSSKVIKLCISSLICPFALPPSHTHHHPRNKNKFRDHLNRPYFFPKVFPHVDHCFCP